MCDFEGQSASCKDRIAYASGHQFKGQDHACTSAYKLLQQQCPICSACSFDASGCSGPAPSTTTVTSTSSLAPGTVTSTTSLAPRVSTTSADLCQTICVLEGKSATCADRVKYTANHVFMQHSNPCRRSHELILDQCSRACNGCTLAATGCGTAEKGKKPASVELSKAHDCQANHSHWHQRWSDDKKSWCCKHEHVGCTKEASSRTYNCNAGFSNWKQEWAADKAAWCCTNEGRGCASSTTTPRHNCHDGYDDWQNKWNVNKALWCCMHMAKGCPENIRRCSKVEE